MNGNGTQRNRTKQNENRKRIIINRKTTCTGEWLSNIKNEKKTGEYAVKKIK